MDYDAVEIVPAPNDYFDRHGPATSATLTRPPTATVLTIVYMQRSAFYMRQLFDGYRQIRFGGKDLSEERPKSTVKFPNQELEIVYDTTLDKQLLQIYARYGWQGVELAEQSMVDASQSSTTGPLHPWKIVRMFFDFTRNRLALNVQDALVEIEAMCADHVVSELSTAAILVNKSWAKLDFQETEISPEGERVRTPSPSLDTPSMTYKKFWEAGNRELANELYAAMDRAVQAQEGLRSRQEKRDRLRSAIQRSDIAPPTGVTEDLKDEEKAIEESVALIEVLYQNIQALVPLAPLLVPMLTIPFNQRKMEHLLGVTLSQFRDHGERLARGINEGRNYLRTIFGTWDVSKPLETHLPDGASVEAKIAKLASENALDKPMYLPILSEGSLNAIVESGLVSRDSFNYLVWAHYKSALMRVLAKERASQEVIQKLVAAVNRVASFLSLALWFVPASRGVRLVSTFMGIGLMAYQAYSILHTLRMLEQTIDLTMVELEANNAAQVAHLSEIIAMPGKYLVDVQQSVLVEITLIIAGGAFDDLKELLHYRAYYLDLETLIEG